MRLRAIFLPLLIFLCGAGELTERAERLVRERPSPSRALGLMEVRRSADAKPPPFRPADLPRPGPLRDATVEAMAWRMIPLPATNRHELDALLDAWAKAGGKSPWIAVLRLYSASLAGDRGSLIAAAGAVAEVPATFPTVAAERAHLDLLKELGLDENSAGLDVLSHRSYGPLHALLDLDRALTRNIDLLQDTSRAADARTLQACRDRLRQAWLDASRHLVERLFALHALGRDPECEALLFAARDLPYLTDPSELGRVLARLDKAQAWQLLIEPMLNSEVQLIATPPKLPTRPTPVAELTIEANAKVVQTGISTYEGGVRVRAGGLALRCDKLAVLGESLTTARILSGTGNVKIEGGAFESVQCDHFSLHLDTGTYTLSGDVRLTQNQRTQKYRVATVGRTGDLRDTVSLLDDVNTASTPAEKLALLPRVTSVYQDDELPPPVAYLLATQLLRPHGTWQPFDGTGTDFPPDSWLREDAIAQAQASSTAPASKVESLIVRDVPARLTWTLRDKSHADVARARRLLESIKEGEFADRARAWLQKLTI